MYYNVNMQVIPSIDIEQIIDLQDQLEKLLPFYNRIHIDFADSQFVNFRTPSVSDILEVLTQHSSSLFDMHLMTLDYQRALEQIAQNCKKINFGIIFIHQAANPAPKLFLEGNVAYKLGLVLNPEDEVDTIKQFYDLSNIENIQIMTIMPGPQGSPFLPHMLNKIEQLRLAGYKNKIFLDGGLNKESLEIIIRQKYLPDFICPGSFFSKATNVEERVQYLSEVLAHESNRNQDS